MFALVRLIWLVCWFAGFAQLNRLPLPSSDEYVDLASLSNLKYVDMFALVRLTVALARLIRFTRKH
jgi:hypothetical protein